MSAPGFFMAAVAMMQIRQVGVLGEVDTNSIRVDTLQTRPLADGFPRVNLAHKHKPLQRVLASPYRAELLAAKGYYIDENQVIRKHSKSNLVPLATPGSDSTISLPTEAPRTHKTTTCRAGVALTLDLPTIARQQVSATGLTNMASIIPTGIASTVDDPTIAPEQNSATELDDMASGPTGLTSNIALSPLDKELPPKPVLRLVESPERRGIYDAFDSGSAKLDCSILQPSTPYIASPTSIRSDGTSFYLTSSLDSAVFDSPELEVGTAVQFLKVSGTELTTIVKNSGRLRSDESGSPLKITEPRNITRRLPTIGQITAFRNGSLVSRHLPNSKFSSRQGVCSSPYGSLKRVQQLKATLKQDVKVMDDVFRVVSASCSDSGSPQRLDSLTRRSMYYDVGPKIRYAKDAHEVIMGDQSASESLNKSAGMSAKSATAGSSSMSLIPKSEKETWFQHGYPSRVSSLPASNNEVASRLARPTKASLARAQANSNITLSKSVTLTSVKKFGSRLSSILPGRGRSDVSVSIDKLKGIGGLDEKKATVAAVPAETNATNVNYKTSIDGRAVLTTFENSGMELKCSDEIADDDAALMGEPSDRVAPQESQRDKRERRAVAFYASEAHNQTNTGRTRQAANQQRGRDQDDDEPPTPNSTPAGPQDHYTEGEQQGDNIQQQLQRELDMLRQAVATPSVPAGADAQYNQLHAQARRIISLLTTMARQVSEQETRTRMTNLIEAIGDSLIAANSNNAAIVAFADANQRLLTATVSLAESANAIAGRAV